RLARAREPSQDDKPVPRDREGNVLQVVQPCAANSNVIGDVIGHLTSRVGVLQRRLATMATSLLSSFNRCKNLLLSCLLSRTTAGRWAAGVRIAGRRS